MDRIDPAVLPNIRDLNHVRNAFSHSAAQSEKQASAWISECQEDLLDVLDDLRGLAALTLARYLGHIDARTIRCETFAGYHLARTIEQIRITAQQASTSVGCFRPGRLFAICSKSLIGLQPLLHLQEDPSGHSTQLLAFRKTRGSGPSRTLEFEVVGPAVRASVVRTDFGADLTDLKSLFGLGAD